MTSTTLDTSTTTATATSATDAGEHAEHRSGLLSILGGVSFLVAPLLLGLGALTSPEQENASEEAYIASLAEDPTLSAVSATFFHYSWVLFAFAALAAIGLVRGRRGRALTTVGGLAAAFGSIQFTGLLFNDWVLAELGNAVPMDQAVQIFQDMGDPSLTAWLVSAQLFGLLGFPVLYAGLARAGVISWWLVPVSLFPMVAFGLIGGVAGVLVGTACAAPAFVTGWRLIQRGRLAA